MNKLYDIVFSTKEDRKLLYFKGEANVSEDELHILFGNTVDFLTYFNSFSISKWKEYTTIKKLQINGKIIGLAEIEVYTIGKEGTLLTKKQVTGDFTIDFDVEKITGEILGIKIKAESKVILQNLNYLGEFEEWKNKKIGVVICTFKREQYVKITIDKLVRFSKKNPWLTTLVVDNGSTLKEYETNNLRIIHNPNYGGSGGFTRGLIENLKSKTNDYVLLMDDDIDLDITVLERTHSVLCGLKKEYRDSFIAGAMIDKDNPYLQYENTGFWNKIKPSSLGRNYDLSRLDILEKNEKVVFKKNKYAGWWYCCIPLKRVEMIGLPLPVFIKGDDIEYSIRNKSEIITMNGIGVWHESFVNKKNGCVNYFADRNMLMINNYIDNTNCFYFSIELFLRMLRRILEFKKQSLFYFYYAISDYQKGFNYITAFHPSDKLNWLNKEVNKSCIYKLLLQIFFNVFVIIIKYEKIKKDYIKFRNKNLGNTTFWNRYLNI